MAPTRAQEDMREDLVASLPMASERMFITGAPRSGTTLLDKVLSVQEVSHVHSQPLPLLFPALKAEFLKHRGTASVFPLNDMFSNNYYDPDEWQSFLKGFRISIEFLENVYSSMRSFSGQYTKPPDIASFMEAYTSTTLASYISSYLTWLGPGNCKVTGFKETWCEEFIPYFSSAGFKCLQILRDPRDVITSLNYGQGRNYGGRLKPLLYNIRSWRKSVAFSQQMLEHPNFLAVKYEDLVAAPLDTLTGILNFLSMEAIRPEDLIRSITDQQGNTWKSNSSHENSNTISAGSVGKYVEYLPAFIVEAIEALCFPEMRLLGYHNHISKEQVAKVISNLDIAENLERPELAEYVWSRKVREEEAHRIELLLTDRYRPEYFLFERAFQQLRTGL